MKFIRQSYTPVVALEITTKGRFKSICEAATSLKVNPNAIREAVLTGTRCGGLWWRFLDMPATCQPLKQTKQVQVYRDDDKHFDGIAAVVYEHHPELAGENTRSSRAMHREHMRVTRAIQREKPYEGRLYRRIFGVKPGTAVPETRRTA
jgi:hypothetical protein